MTTAALDAPTVAAIERLCAEHPNAETGGLIFIGPNGGYATGPGPMAVRHTDALEWDPSYMWGCIETAAGLFPGCTVWGRWHAHPSPVILPSAQDKESAELFRKALGIDEIVDIIVATDAGRPIAWAAYLCTDAGYERVELDLAGSYAEPGAL